MKEKVYWPLGEAAVLFLGLNPQDYIRDFAMEFDGVKTFIVEFESGEHFQESREKLKKMEGN